MFPLVRLAFSCEGLSTLDVFFPLWIICSKLLIGFSYKIRISRYKKAILSFLAHCLSPPHHAVLICGAKNAQIIKTTFLKTTWQTIANRLGYLGSFSSEQLFRWGACVCKSAWKCPTDIPKYIWNWPWYRLNSSISSQDPLNPDCVGGGVISKHFCKLIFLFSLLLQICVADSATGFDLNILHLNISHFCFV